MLRGDVDFGTGKSDTHAAIAAMAGRIGSAGFGGRRNLAVAHPDFALIEIFNTQRIAKGASKFLKFQNFAGVRFFVDAMQRLDAASKKIMGDGAVGGEHELFDEPMRDVAFSARDIDHALLVIEFDDRLGKIEIDGAIFVAPRVEEQCEIAHGAETVGERGITADGFGIALKYFVDVGVGHALDGANDARGHSGTEDTALRVEIHEGAKDQAVFPGLQGTHAIG